MPQMVLIEKESKQCGIFECKKLVEFFKADNITRNLYFKYGPNAQLNMDQIHPTILNTTVEAIPILTEENVSPPNRARVYKQFSRIEFNTSNIEKFITEVQDSIMKMEDFGICMYKDIMTYDLFKRIPVRLNNIKQSITHSKNGVERKTVSVGN
ncbi:hypothetical protein VP01_2632g1 [Puccinia sorghi]|uniref:Uncharacterized protein n=1 Tax=Puccinia sorghi TaxID=27349 RepID=A0A0L6V656_9BASI|nr:hypothetical protein VP01_2632g1 [Puccinia sorghi]